MNTFKWAILGPGRIAQTFVDAVRAIPEATVVAVASRQPGRAEAFADANAIPNWFDRYEDMLADPEIDAVYIANTNPCHFDSLKLCLQHGKPVLCEKPLCLNEMQTEEILSLAKAKNLFLMEGIWTRCLPIHRELEKWIAEGRIGELRTLRADIGFSAPWPDDDRHVDPKNGGGALLDVGVYNVAFAVRHLGRDPISVKSVASRWKTGVDARSTVLLEYPEGRTAVLTCAIDTMMPHDAVLYGSSGSVRLPFYWRGGEAEISRFGKPFTPPEVTVEKWPYEIGNGYAHEVLEAMNCIREGKLESPSMPWADSLAISRILTGLRREWQVRYDGQPGEE